MAYTPVTPEAGIQPIAAIPSTGTVNHPLGTRIRAYDPTFGEGEFIYLYGVASNTVGSVVSYNQLSGAVTLLANTSDLALPLAVSMTANTSTTTGSWYQVVGAAVVKKTAVKVSPASKLYISATTGRVMSTVATSKQVMQMMSINAATVASATSTVTCQIVYPFAQPFGTT
jgi:hypothetical protein